MNTLLLLRGLVIRCCDLVFALLLFLLFRQVHYDPIDPEQLEIFVWFCLAAYFVSFQVTGVYQALSKNSPMHWCNKALQGWLAFTLSLLFYLYLFKESTNFPRGTILPWLVATPCCMLALRFLWRQWERRANKKGLLQQRALVIGTVQELPAILGHLGEEDNEHGERLIGYVTADGAPIDENALENRPQPCLGKIADIAAIVDTAAVSHVIISLPPEQLPLLSEIRRNLRKQPVHFSYAPNLSGLPLVGLRAEDRGGWPFFNLTASPIDGDGVVWKWLEDKIIGIFSLIIFALPMLAIAALIKLTSPGPVLFIQERHGIHGKPIRVYKFRSMRLPDDTATFRKAKSGQETTGTGSFKQAKQDDPRITWVGNLLRRSSFDELPQLFNVLKGDMSLVGPRPHALAHNLQFIEEVDDLMQRHQVKPGMTGLAQINGCRGETPDAASMSKRVAYDLEYIRNWSLVMDAKILFMTPFIGFLNKQP